VLVSLGTLAGQPAIAVQPAPLPAPLSTKTPFVDETYQADAGYTEGNADVECCPDDAECSSPWRVDAGVICLSRNRATARPSAQVYTRPDIRTTPSLAFDMVNCGLGTAVGPDITLSRCLGSSCWEVEARYFQLDGWSNTHFFDAGPTGSVSVVGYGTQATSQAQSLAYASRLYNVELNLRWNRCEAIPFLLGFRTLELDERFYISSQNPPLGIGADSRTNNSLYGLQIGTEPILWDRCGRFRLEGLLKAGVYGNRAHQCTRFPQTGSQLNSIANVPSFVGELGLIGNVSLNKSWSLRAGYEIFWITNVALAPDQAATVQYSAPPTGAMFDKATALYYGATASIERKF
jgi:hypothetical protein